MIPHALQTSRGVVLRTIGSVFTACSLFAGGGLGGSLDRPTLGQTGFYALGVAFPVFLCVALLAIICLLVAHSPHASIAALSGAFIVGDTTTKKTDTPATKPAKIREMEANLKALAKELEQGQLEMTAGPITTERGEELEAKATEMEDLQKHLDQYNRIAGTVKRSKEIEKITLPGDGDPRSKRVKTTAGHIFVMSSAFKNWKSVSGSSQSGWSGKVDVKGRLGQKHVTLTGDQAIEFERKAFDPATLSDLGVDVIVETQRDPEIIRYEEPEILTIRDVLNQSGTTSDSIRYVRHIATDRAAASQNPRRGGAKPYLKVEYAAETVNVETIAVLSKVTEQDVDDAPRLVSAINGEMRLDIKVVEENQLLWGTGTNGQIKGLFHADYNIPEFDRAVAGDTAIDLIRRMRTDLRKVRVQPNFVTIDPIDWEEIELAKGTDTHYLWGLISDLRGPRIWSLRVVESDAMTRDTVGTGDGERRILMGDGIRGATVYDRHDVRFAIGFVDDDFARNLRTLRAEERLALAVKRDWAFEYAVTNPGAP